MRGHAHGLARVKTSASRPSGSRPSSSSSRCRGDSAAYHGYWGLDFTRVDPHLGTNADFAAFVDCAHSLGMKVYLDIVVNHTADVILLSGGTSYRAPEETPYRDCKGEPYSAQRYAGGKRFPCLSARYQPRQAIVLPEKRTLKRPAWLNDVTRYHNRGDIDFSSCSARCFEQETSSGSTTSSPSSRSWSTASHASGATGFAARRSTASAWTPRSTSTARSSRRGCRRFARRRALPAFGVRGVREVFETDAATLASFVRERGVPNVIDFPCRTRSCATPGLRRRAWDRDALGDDDYFRLGNGVAPHRHLSRQPRRRPGGAQDQGAGGGVGAELLARDLLGHSLLYLLRGAPAVYYGDEVGMVGRGGDKAARQDLSDRGRRVADRGARGIRSHRQRFVVRPRHAPGLTASPRSERSGMRTRALDGRVVRPRRARGDARREQDRPGGAARVPAAFNASEARVRHGANGDAGLVLDVAPRRRHGEHEPRERPNHVADPAALRDAVPGRVGPSAARCGSREGARRPDRFTNLVRVAATSTSVDPLSVTFAVKRPGKKWTRVGTDDGAPYGVFVDPRDFRRGQSVSFVAVARASDGSVSTSPVIATRLR